jgi:hypothetical protein
MTSALRMLDLETTTTGVNAATMEIRFKIERMGEMYDRRSNEAADEAMIQGLIGDPVAASLAAELADAYAALAHTARWLDTMKGDL